MSQAYLGIAIAEIAIAYCWWSGSPPARQYPTASWR